MRPRAAALVAFDVALLVALVAFATALRAVWAVSEMDGGREGIDIALWIGAVGIGMRSTHAAQPPPMPHPTGGRLLRKGQGTAFPPVRWGRLAGSGFPWTSNEYPAAMRFAAVDMGSNSTRLLIADLDADGHLTEIARRSTVTRLGHRVDATGRLDPDAIERFTAELGVIRELLDEHDVDRAVGVMTSAVRDADDGPELMTAVRERFAIEALVIPGQQEAALTYLGATSGRDGWGSDPSRPVAVVDVGGGSTEFVIGHDATFDFSVSVQAGVVRHSERHLQRDPPDPAEIRAMSDEAAAIFRDAVPAHARRDVETVIAVAGTATSCASMLLELDEYDLERVHGFRLQLAEIEALLARLAMMTDAERRNVRGLQPNRSPTIVAGCALLAEALRTFGVKQCEVSEHDILRGVIIAAAQGTL